jgi:regulator of protease activity HflC (stomatin/prohibitin superfamily)
MEGALGWIGQIATWVGQFFPRWVIVPATHAAVKFVRGHKVVPLQAGWHVYWPLTTEMLVHAVVRQALVLRPQTLTTTDGKTVAVGLVISYDIDDIEKCLVGVWEPDETIEEIALGIANHAIARKSWGEVQTAHQSGRLDAQLLTAARKALRRYGVRVIQATVTDLAPCRVLKLMGVRS